MTIEDKAKKLFQHYDKAYKKLRKEIQDIEKTISENEMLSSQDLKRMRALRCYQECKAEVYRSIMVSKRPIYKIGKYENELGQDFFQEVSEELELSKIKQES